MGCVRNGFLQRCLQLAVFAVVAAAAMPSAVAAAPFANFGSFGTPNGSQGGQLSSVSRGVAVNRSGVGAAVGSVYVAEAFPNHRISQFSAEGEFVRTWGFDVVDGVNHPGAANDNGTGFEVCDVTAGNTADQCKAGVGGDAAGQLSNPMGVAVDQSNGYLYVTSTNNRRVDVFSGTGEFAGAFGYDVRPADPDPSGLDFCTTVTGCQAAAGGGGDAGRFGDWGTSNPAVDPNEPGRIYLPDDGNLRVAHYETTVSGGVLTAVSFVKAFGSDVVASGPGNRTVPRNEQQRVSLAAYDFACGFCPMPITGGTFTLSFDPDGGGALPAETTGPIAYDATAGVVQQRLVDDLASIAAGDVSVSGGPGPDAPWTVAFAGAYAGEDVADLFGDGSALTTPPGGFVGAGVNVETTVQGGQFPAGYEVCVPGDGDVCQQGSSGNGAGEFTSGGSPSAVAVDSTGAIYATSGPLGEGTCSAETPCRIQKFSPDASIATDFGPSVGPGQLTFTSGAAGAVAALNFALDPANDHVFVLRKENTDSYRVLEYDSAGNHLDTHPAGAALPANDVTAFTGIAVGTAGRVYANYGGAASPARVFILGPVDPPTVTVGSPTDVGATTATFSGTVDIPPPGSPTFDTTYHFEYSKNGVDWTAIPAPDANVGDGSTGTHVVTETVTGLDPNTLYSVRLVATTGPTATSSAVSFTTDATSPRVALTFVDEVTQTAARLGAHVDPEGARTTYHFEWGSQPCSTAPDACASVPAFERQLGSDNQVLIANEPIDGLQPATTYHYRVVATNASGTTTGPDQRFETLNGCNLTDGRCYEMVSPPDKGPVGAAGDIVALGQELRLQAAEDRPAVAYTLAYGLPDGTAGDEAVFQASRTDSGWSSEQLEAPALIVREQPGDGSTTSLTNGLSRNLECGVFSSNQPLGDDPPTGLLQAGAVALYSRSAAGTWTGLTNAVPANPLQNIGSGLFQFDLIGMSQDAPCARVVFRSAYQYPGVDGAGAFRTYWWEGGMLGYVGVIPGPCSGGACVAEAIPGAAFTTGTTSLGDVARNFQRAISEDGRRVFFTAISQQGDDTGRQAVFMRDRGMPVAMDVSQSQTGSLPGGTANTDDAVYQTASVDGSKVFFTGRYGLASNAAGAAVHSSTGATSCAEDGTGCDLYEYDVASGTLSDLSVPHPGANNAGGASVVGVLGADDDGTHVYFAARGKLAPGEGATEGRNLADDTYNVYLAHAGSVAYVGQIEERGGGGGFQLVRFANTNGAGPLPYWSSRVSADGGRLLFQSKENLTDYDARGVPQAYLYDVSSGKTVCVSCPRDDRDPTPSPSNGQFAEGPLVAGQHTQTPITAPRTLTVDGRRAFFVSYDDLATGGTEGRPNLYQWEDGQVSFLASSAPTSTSADLRFGGASANGDDVYFATVDKYTWQDRDGKLDVYDARVGGRFDAPPSAPAPCNPLAGQDCQQGAGAGSVGATVETHDGAAGNALSPARLALRVRALSARQLRLLAAGRRVAVHVRVTGAGRVSVRGVAKIGRSRRTVISGSRRATGAGSVRVPVRLSKAARGRIATRRSLAVRLTVRLSGARRAQVRRLVFKSPRAHERGQARKQASDIRRSASDSRAATNDRRAAK